MKKVLSAFLAALMCILPLVTGVSAAVPEGNDVLYTIEDASIKKIDITEDSTVEVAIFIESTKALNSIALSNFDYSKGALEFVEFSDFTDEFKSLLVFDTMKPDSNRGAVTAAIRSTTFSTPMKICTATFKVKTTADVGEYDISCDVLTKNGNQILASELDVQRQNSNLQRRSSERGGYRRSCKCNCSIHS